MPSPSTPPSSDGAAPSPEIPFAARLEPLKSFVPLGTTFLDWAMLRERATPNGIFRPVFDAPAPTMERCELHVTTLKPGANPHAPHYHPWEEMLVLKEGSLRVSINGRIQPASAGAVIFFASNDAHTVWNDSSQPVTYYVINFHSAAVHTAGRDRAPAAAQADRLGSCVVQWADAATKTGPHDTRRGFFNAETTTLTRLKAHATTVAPGRYPVKNVSHLHLILLIVKEGVIESTINGVTHLVGAGSMIFLAPEAIQTLSNPGDMPATYYVIAASSAQTPEPA
jgi:quercetin dioxygenase-like cupin family protein